MEKDVENKVVKEIKEKVKIRLVVIQEFIEILKKKNIDFEPEEVIVYIIKIIEDLLDVIETEWGKLDLNKNMEMEVLKKIFKMLEREWKGEVEKKFRNHREN